MTVVKVVLCILIVFTAIGLACAVAIARSRDAGVGRRSDTPPDPFSHPFGEPRLTPASFAQATPLSLPPDDPLGDLLRSWQTVRNPVARILKFPTESAGLALRSDAGGGRRLFPSGPAATRFPARFSAHMVEEASCVTCAVTRWKPPDSSPPRPWPAPPPFSAAPATRASSAAPPMPSSAS
jgi:hypothetical protein